MTEPTGRHRAKRMPCPAIGQKDAINQPYGGSDWAVTFADVLLR